LGYKHWKSGFKSVKAVDYRNAYWAWFFLFIKFVIYLTIFYGVGAN
jgi:hypothetical protein